MSDQRFYVYIIESPSADDLLVNRLEGRVLSEALGVSGIDCNYQLAANPQTFNQSITLNLESIFMQDSYRRIPVLHISAHGNHQGVALTDNSFIPWENFYQRLLDINNKFNGNLLVSVSACFGAFAGQLITPNRPSPCFALIGPTMETELSDLAIGYSALYHNIKKTWNLEVAFNAMKIASGNQRFNLTLGNQANYNYQQSTQNFFRV